MMEQLLLFATWADEMNRRFDERDVPSWSHWRPEFPWQAMWIECESAEYASSLARSMSGKSHLQADEDGLWHCVRVVGRYTCIRCLPSGPIFKLSEWDQLDVGRSIMLHPEPDAETIRLAQVRVGTLRRAGRGSFDLQRRDDGTLWVTRLELGGGR